MEPGPGERKRERERERIHGSSFLLFIGPTETSRRSGIRIKVKIDTPVLWGQPLPDYIKGPGDILIFEYDSLSLSLSLSHSLS